MTTAGLSSQALYLKWRPQGFDDVVGQEHVTHTLQNALRSGRISHAYLFTGPRGTGKTTMARVLAKAVNCLHPDIGQRPCNQCRICTAINEGRLLDLIEMDAASNTGVDNVREAIREKVGFRPNEARYKVYVIDEVHMLSTSAFNALLKTLEEPPDHVIFVLATTEPHKILPTIISRCQRFDFKRISQSAMVARLQHIATQEGLRVQEEALRFIARMSTGCARDAISLLDQLTAYGDDEITAERVGAVLGLGRAETIYELLEHLVARQPGRGLEVIHRAVESGIDVRQFTQQVMDYLRLLLMLRIGDETGGDTLTDMDAQTRDHLRALAGRLPAREWVRAIRLFNQAQLDLRGSDQNQITLELALVEASLEEAPVAASQPITAAQPAPHSAAPMPTPTVSTQSLSTPAPVSVQRAAAPSRTPPRSEPESPPTAVSEPTGDEVTMEQVSQYWAQIRQAIRTQSRPVEALVNSAVLRGIEGGNCLVFDLPSRLLCEKLEKVETRRMIEEAIRSVLGKRCTIRAQVAGAASESVVQEASPPFERAPAATVSASPPAAGQTPTRAAQPVLPDIQQQAHSDPLVQDLLRRGGRIVQVESLS